MQFYEEKYGDKEEKIISPDKDKAITTKGNRVGAIVAFIIHSSHPTHFLTYFDLSASVPFIALRCCAMLVYNLPLVLKENLLLFIILPIRQTLVPISSQISQFLKSNNCKSLTYNLLTGLQKTQVKKKENYKGKSSKSFTTITTPQ